MSRKVHDQDHTHDEEHEGAPGVQDVPEADDHGQDNPRAHDGAEECHGSPHHRGGHDGEKQANENDGLDGRTEPLTGARRTGPPGPGTCPRGLFSAEVVPHAPSGSPSTTTPASGGGWGGSTSPPAPRGSYHVSRPWLPARSQSSYQRSNSHFNTPYLHRLPVCLLFYLIRKRTSSYPRRQEPGQGNVR